MTNLMKCARIAPVCLALFASSVGAGNEFVTKVTLANPFPHDSFGASLALSGDCLLVGAPADGPGTDRGAAVLFTRHGDDWLEEQVFPLPDRATSFGRVVALGADQALVSSFILGGGYRVWAYSRSGSDWVLHQELVSNATARDFFGASLALSGDTLLVGAPGTSLPGEETPGFVHVFALQQGSWQPTAILSGDLLDEDAFGFAVDLHGDTALVGAPHAYSGSATRGSAFVFVRSGSSWSQQAELGPAPGVLRDRIGSTVGVYGDLAVIAGYGTGAGAFTFRRSAGAWTQENQLRDDLQHVVAIDGDLIAVANNGYLGTGGSGRLWVGIAGALHPQARVAAFDPVGMQYFGRSVSISGGTIAVGALRAGPPINAGGVYIFDRPVGEGHCTATVNSSGAPAIASARGTPSIQANDLELAATSVPDTPGLFFAGPVGIQVPFGPGYRCVGGAVLRLGASLASDSVLRKSMNLSNGVFTPGSTWHFQAWYRDNLNGAQSFNTSSSLSVTFAP